MKKIIRSEGILSLYRGSLLPLFLTGFASSIQFTVNNSVKKFFNNQNFSSLYASGAVAGMTTSLILSPMELIKIQLQVKNSPFKGNLDAVQYIYRHFGLRGMYRGLGITTLRDMQLGFFFGGFSFMSQQLTNVDGTKPWYSTIVCATFSGFALWTACLPFDNVKTKIQNDNLHDPKFKNIRQCV